MRLNLRMGSSGKGMSLDDTSIALTIKRRGFSESVEWCANECRTGDGALREGSFVASLLGRDFFLCRPCARAWPRLWRQALAGFPEDRAESERRAA